MAYSRYEYGTSPRKYDVPYTIDNRRKRNNSAPKKKEKKVTVEEHKASLKVKAKTLGIIIAVFAAILLICYRNSQIDVAFKKNEELKVKVSSVEKENDQMKVDIENSLNLYNVEQQAKEQLGMQSLTNKQTVYVNLPKKDYIQPASESVKIEENQNIFQKAFNLLKTIF